MKTALYVNHSVGYTVIWNAAFSLSTNAKILLLLLPTSYTKFLLFGCCKRRQHGQLKMITIMMNEMSKKTKDEFILQKSKTLPVLEYLTFHKDARAACSPSAKE